MKDLDRLRPWLQLQALYAQQLAELGRAKPDLALLARLAARAEQLLQALTRAQQLDPPSEAQRLQVKTAAAAAAELLARTKAQLERMRAQRLEQARQRERTTSAVLAYRGKGTAAAPRFLDQRR